MNRGFSIGIGDVTPGEKLIEGKEKLVDEGWVWCIRGKLGNWWMKGGCGVLEASWATGG